MRSMRVAPLLLAALPLALPLALHAQRVERFSLRGNRVAVYNIAGKITVERGTGSAVEVEITRGGHDAGELRLEQRTVDGRESLCVVYPDERLIYRPQGSRSDRSSTTTSTDGNCQEPSRGVRGMFNRGRRIEVRSQGDGVEAWADIRVMVPAGRDVKVWNVVGGIDAFDVDATLNLDVSAARVVTNRTRGTLNIDTGSGSATVDGHRGDLTIDVGSGSVQISNIDGTLVKVDAGSGGLRGNNVSADEFSLETGSGSVNFESVTSRRTHVETGSGGARMDFVSSPESIDISTGSGSVTVALPANFGAQVDVQTGSGGISSDFALQTERGRRNELHGTIGNGRGRVRIETGSGGVQLLRGSGGTPTRRMR